MVNDIDVWFVDLTISEFFFLKNRKVSRINSSSQKAVDIENGVFNSRGSKNRQTTKI